jgi:hypothetical protein
MSARAASLLQGGVPLGGELLRLADRCGAVPVGRLGPAGHLLGVLAPLSCLGGGEVGPADRLREAGAQVGRGGAGGVELLAQRPGLDSPVD